MSLVITRAAGLVTVQDLGRPGHMHEALPHGGALVRGFLVAANRAVGNPDNAPAIEVCGELVVRADAEVEVASSNGGRVHLAPGRELAVTSEPYRAAYVAVKGGIEAPLVLGGRGTQLSAGLGALIRVGDRLEVSNFDTVPPEAPEAPDAPDAPDASEVSEISQSTPSPIRVLPGPDAAAFEADVLGLLELAAYRILPASDRVGTRLAGLALPRVAEYRALSRPMVCGAIEVPGDGMPIVLGREHPTTGGYPVVAVIAARDLDRFFAIRIGGEVHFEVGHIGTSRSSIE
jgi:allophanate hydrolase subunit 2